MEYHRLMDILTTFLTGIAIGMANVIPGVSGGTLAVVFNIYDKFINAITYNVKKLWQNRRFVIPILCGMALGVLLFSKIITILYTRFPLQTNCFFTGLIIGSIPLLFKKMLEQKENEKLTFKKIVFIAICLLLAAGFLLWFSTLEGKRSADDISSFVLPQFNWPLAFKIFCAGFLGSVAMVIPGISGSLIMLIMGVYTIIITAIPALFSTDTFFHALILLLPNGLGVLAGLIAGAKFVSYLLKKCPSYTYAAITGLLLASAVNIFPGFENITGALVWIASLLSFAGGFFMAYFSNRFTKSTQIFFSL